MENHVDKYKKISKEFKELLEKVAEIKSAYDEAYEEGKVILNNMSEKNVARTTEIEELQKDKSDFFKKKQDKFNRIMHCIFIPTFILLVSLSAFAENFSQFVLGTIGYLSVGITYFFITNDEISSKIVKKIIAKNPEYTAFQENILSLEREMNNLDEEIIKSTARTEELYSMLISYTEQLFQKIRELKLIRSQILAQVLGEESENKELSADSTNISTETPIKPLTRVKKIDDDSTSSK